MLYTRKGDTGTTKTFGCDQRVSKSSAIAEALGTLDECNSFLGVCKTNPDAKQAFLEGYTFADIVDWIQQNLFIVQAHVAGADKTIAQEKITHMESAIDAIEKEVPPIKTFFVSGGTSLAAQFDFARTLARRAERRVVGVSEEQKEKVAPGILVFLNRLSSLLYALARLVNHRSGVKEEKPMYE